jgi:hypothetical protein
LSGTAKQATASNPGKPWLPTQANIVWLNRLAPAMPERSLNDLHMAQRSSLILGM